MGTAAYLLCPPPARADAPPCPNQDLHERIGGAAAVGIPAYGRRVRARLGAEKPGKRRMRPPAREAPACFQDVAYGCSAPKPAPAAASFPGIKRPSGKRGNSPTRPPRRESPLIPPRFRPAAVRPESRHPSCPPRGFQRKRKRQRPMRPPRRAEAPPGVPGPGSKNALASSPCRAGGVFSCPVSRRARKEPRRGR